MRALIIISASLAMVMEPSSTCATNSFTRSLPRSLASPNRPCSTIWSSKLASWVSTAAAEAAAFATASGIVPSCADLALQLVQFFGVAHRFEQQFFKLVVALQRTAQVRKPRTQIEELFQGLDLLGHVGRLEIVKFPEFQIDFQVGRIGVVAQLVFDGEREMRFHAFQNGVKVVGVHLDELAFLQLGQGLFGIAGKVSEHADDEGQFLDLDGAANFDVIRDLHPGRTDPIELMLRTLFSHDEFLRQIVIKGDRTFLRKTL